MTLRTGAAWENSEEAECRRGLCKYLYKKWGAGKKGWETLMYTDRMLVVDQHGCRS